jgi:hypothetical protein
MASRLQDFLEKSEIAQMVKLNSRVVLQRMILSPGDIVSIKKQGEYGPIPKEEELCEFVAGGQVLANGRIVKKRGKYYFKVLKTYIGTDVKGGSTDENV